ncbi:hypothetical protein B0J12DRAFT_730820 [Macrophomina phaseolina]|uniref:Integrase zinc-binding domain-containing protein n=1 Tax=Macrophomina phaseolina TaxID=35725 RepID=A0ABQ8G4F1_9PEZI|nr:hypothetical protein B0J12DRAFT_730820 [Macrophomina phaseolina]
MASNVRQARNRRQFNATRAVIPFPPSVRTEWNIWHAAQIEAQNDRRVRFSRRLYAEYVQWLEEPGRRPANETEKAVKRHVLQSYVLINGALNKRSLNARTEYEFRKVLLPDDVFDVIKEAHLRTGHAGIQSTYRTVHETYWGATRVDVTWLLERCHVCTRRERRRTKR